ncbi:MAG TPA: glycoside hydrolase family 38 C-terminal domain-containing protein, partial [Candidatus Hydrogenedentes bacterium]|nr:glycoside hydrolase family 38 C-terminal domain-containing protein [Candidatus Hydrogenedentota bacterium]
RHHRLRAVFPTRLQCDRTDAEIAYDVISRDITVKPGNPYYGRPNPQYPMYRFVDMTDGQVGLAVLNNSGIREYEAMDRADRPLAITFIRAFTFRNSPVFGRWETYPDMELAQCPGRFTYTYALYPHAGDWTNGVLAEAEMFNMPLEPAQAGPHPGALPKKLGMLSVSGENLQITALKRAEDRADRWILRIYNPTWQNTAGKIHCWRKLTGAWQVNLNEEHPQSLVLKDDHTCQIDVPAKKIITLMLAWE